MADAIRPFVGARVLEIGAGIGNITQQLVPRDAYVASDINPNYLHYLRNMAAGKPYLTVARIDLESPESFADYSQRFDTVICLNVLEHVRDPMCALRSMFGTLAPGGRLVLYVPRGQKLYGSLDEALGHRCRYELPALKGELEKTGFEVEQMDLFNRVSVLGWWWNGKMLGKRTFSRWHCQVESASGTERWFPSFRQLSGQIKVKSGFIDQAASGCDEVGQSPGLGAAPTLYASSGVRSPSDECGRRLL